MKNTYLEINDLRIEDVFHYTNIDSLEQIVVNNSFKITNCGYVNDKTELEYVFTLINKMYYSGNGYNNIKNDTLEKSIKHIKEYLERSYILSFSVNSDSLALWGNYSQFEGYNINFNIKKIFKRFNDSKVFIVNNKKNENGEFEKISFKAISENISICCGKVIYDLKKQKKIIASTLNNLDDIYENRDIDIESICKTLACYSQLFKDPCFKQEEEYRIIFTIDENIDVMKFKKCNGVFMPYIEIVFEDYESQNVKGLPIESITIGPKNNMDIAARGLKEFLNSEGFRAYLENESSCDDCSGVIIKKSRIPLRY